MPRLTQAQTSVLSVTVESPPTRSKLSVRTVDSLSTSSASITGLNGERSRWTNVNELVYHSRRRDTTRAYRPRSAAGLTRMGIHSPDGNGFQINHGLTTPVISFAGNWSVSQNKLGLSNPRWDISRGDVNSSTSYKQFSRASIGRRSECKFSYYSDRPTVRRRLKLTLILNQ